MQKIDAYWEKRNIGTECLELNVEENDNLIQVAEALDKSETEYQVVRIPAGMTDGLFLVQNKGFNIIEMNIQFEKNISVKPVLPKQYSRFNGFFGYHEADRKEIESILKAVESGEMFVTDKIARDPFFSPKLAGRRYALWAGDVIARGSKMFISTYRDELVGFSMNIDKGSYFDAFLGGVLPECKRPGMGFLPLFVNLVSIYEQGGRVMKTGVSSNNLPIIKLHEAFNCTISGMSYIFIKHKTGRITI